MTPASLNRSKLAEFCPEELEWVDKLAIQLAPPELRRRSSSASSELTAGFAAGGVSSRGNSGRVSKRSSRVLVARLDRRIERLPVEQVDIGQRRLQHDVGELRCAARPDTLFTMPACIRIWKILMRRLPPRPRAKNFHSGGPSSGPVCAEKIVVRATYRSRSRAPAPDGA